MPPLVSLTLDERKVPPHTRRRAPIFSWMPAFAGRLLLRAHQLLHCLRDLREFILFSRNKLQSLHAGC